MRACATSPVSLYEHATQSRRIGSLWCAAHDTSGPMHHAQPRTFVPRVLARGLPCHALRTCMPLHLVLAAPVIHHAHVVKNTKAISSGDAKCKMRHQIATLRLIAHATHAPEGESACSAPYARTLSVCFHETIRMESSHLNTHLSFIPPPMWDKVQLFLCFSIQCSKHSTLSIDISFILATFWTWFSFFAKLFQHRTQTHK
ncbi:hypothetical protein HanIR_Chr05g0208141 [Helianthus annuus]|nr:hypothetical protein HanIR_Chr05g0208141 [Helianthus annuus]